MSADLLQTKLYLPPVRPALILRPRLIEQLNRGLQQGRKLTLLSAPAGFGKTTLVSEWLASNARPSAWLSLDEADGDLNRFLTYFVAALQTVAPEFGAGMLAALQLSQQPPAESILSTLLNEITAIPDNFILVLDDYHVIEATLVDDALTFLLKHLPPQMHLVITTREDPPLPLARLRARGRLTELRAADLRFASDEAAEFLNTTMGLELSSEDVAALERRTEGWIVGLQLAALALQGPIAMQGQKDVTGFIDSFTGSHRFVLDYLIEEVLQQQPENVQTFLLRTSILDRFCGPLCEAVLDQPAPFGQETLEFLEQANLFIVPLDDERRWYRYHHLFAELLQQRLEQRATSSAADRVAPTAVGIQGVEELHLRASVWFEDNGLELEAFHHAAAANDVERAECLVAGGGMPLHFRGAVTPVLNWLASLPESVLDARPLLWVMYASALTLVGQPVSTIEEKLEAAEAAIARAASLDPAVLQNGRPDAETNDLFGQIAAIRALLAVPQNRLETIVAHARKALELLPPDNLPLRTAATWALGHAHQLQGDRAAARQAYDNILSITQASGNLVFQIAAATGLGQVQESENRLHQAADAYRQVLQLAGDPPLPVACGAYLGLTRIFYEWNDLDAAEEYGQQCLQLARLLENNDAPAMCQEVLARLRLARGDLAGAVATLAQAEHFVRQNNFVHRMPDVAAAQVLTMLHQGDLAAAAELATKHHLLISQARVHLAQGDPTAALAQLEPMRCRAEAEGRLDEQLRVLVLQSVALWAQGELGNALQTLGDALALAEPGGFIRLFLDEGPPMAALLSEGVKQDIVPSYLRRLQASFGEMEGARAVTQRLAEPLTDREREVLRLLGTELNGPAIARELMVSLNTVRTHTKHIYSKLGVNNRRSAVRRAEELHLL